MIAHVAGWLLIAIAIAVSAAATLAGGLLLLATRDRVRRAELERDVAVEAGELERELAQLLPTSRGVHVLPVDGVALDADQLRALRRPDLPPATDARD